MKNISILIPIYQETAALSFSKFYFDQLGLNPTYVLDSKRIDRRNEVEALLGRSVAIYENPGSFAEANFQNFLDLADTDWVLRIDCDEVPNLAMLEHCKKFSARPTDHYCGFDRDDLIWQNDHFDRLAYAPLFVDSQYRLFNRNKVKVVEKVHTPGFHVPKWKLPFPIWHAPRSARLYHLQRVFLSYQQRLEKSARYDSGGQSAQLSLWNTRLDDSFKWKPMRDDALTNIFLQWTQSKEA